MGGSSSRPVEAPQGEEESVFSLSPELQGASELRSSCDHSNS